MIIDYSNGDMLASVPEVVNGTVQYHLQWPGGEYARNALTTFLATVPDGSYVLWDTEPWLHKPEGDYNSGDQARNIALFHAYADTLWHFGPQLRARKITLHVYQAPALLAKNWTVIRREHGHPNYESWEADQLRILFQAEASGMLPALRACKGGVALPLYIPSTWIDGKKWSDNLERLIKNLDAVLDANKVDHVWMMRPDCGGQPLDYEHLKVILSGQARNRLAVWGTPTTPGWAALKDAFEIYPAPKPVEPEEPVTQEQVEELIDSAVELLTGDTEEAIAAAISKLRVVRG